MSHLAVTPSPSAARGGRALGAMSFFVFGGAWLVFGLREVATAPAAAFAIIAILTLALVLLAFLVYRANVPALREAADLPSARRRRRLFNWINAGQWLLIIAVGNFLAFLDLSRWVVPSIIGLVGLHLLPLASVLRYRPHYLTGAALLLLAVSYPLLASGGPVSSVGPLGAGTVLWLSAAWALASSRA